MGNNLCSKEDQIVTPPMPIKLERDPNSNKFPKGTFEVLNPGEFSQKYNISTRIGNGRYGFVNICTLIEDPNIKRAVKQVSKEEAEID
jgi:hypothetical protein